MKKNFAFIAGVGFASLPVLSGWAIDRPLNINDTSLFQGKQQEEVAPDNLKPIPAPANNLWLGIIPAEVPPVLLAQLELNGNPGIVVEGTIPQGPADKAGILDMDIVLRIDGQPISKEEDLWSALQSHKAGDQVAVELLRGGKKKTVAVTLEEGKSRLNHRAHGNVRKSIDQAIGAGRTPLPMGKAPGNNSPIRMLLQNMAQMQDDSNLDPFGNGDFGDFEDAIERVRKMMGQSMGGFIPKSGNTLPQGQRMAHRSSTMRFSDGKGEIVFSDNGSGMKVAVYDRNGKLLYEGAYQTDEDKKNVPPEIKARLDRVQVGG